MRRFLYPGSVPSMDCRPGGTWSLPIGSSEPGVGWGMWEEFRAQGEDASLQVDAPIPSDQSMGSPLKMPRVASSRWRISNLQMLPTIASLPTEGVSSEVSSTFHHGPGKGLVR